MEIVNKINRGIHLDFDEYEQPAGTLRDNRNGVILDYGEGNFKWTNLDGTELIFRLQSSEIIFKAVKIRRRVFFLVLNKDENKFKIYESSLYSSGAGFASLITSYDNSVLNINEDNPIRQAIGIYENEDIQRIYITDYNNQPRIFNVAPGNISSSEKFVNFYPTVDNAYGEFKYIELLNGGSCKAGSYCFAWRYVKDGYYTDWSYLTSPISVLPGDVSGKGKKFQEMQGDAPDENTKKRIKFEISHLDGGYEFIEVCYFYSNDYNSFESGIIFYSGGINVSYSPAKGYYMEFILNGSEFINTVTITELIETSIRVEKCKDMHVVKNIMAISNLVERKEINTTSMTDSGRADTVDVEIYPIVKKILLDTQGYSDGENVGFTESALVGVSPMDHLINDVKWVISGITYEAITEVEYAFGAGVTIPAGEIFTPGGNDVYTITSGTVKAVLVKSMYGTAPYYADVNTAKQRKFYIENHYYNYKNPLFTTELKGYPGGEKVRLGIVFYDKTGRPYFARYLKNTETGGDTTMPSRTDSAYKVSNEIDEITYSSPAGTAYNILTGNVLGLKVSNLDITSIKDEIGGFAIVRAPIERRIISYGILAHLLEESDGDIRLKPGFINYASDVDVWPKGYSFISPEDQFELKDFSLQKGDRFVNAYYIKPYYEAEVKDGFTGFGRRDCAYPRKLYQKYCINYSGTGSGNGEIGISHELSAYTKYKLADDTGDGIAIDPSDASRLFFEGVPITAGANSTVANTGIAIFDELENAGADIKGSFNRANTEPIALMCYVERDIPNDYGGGSESSLANTKYIGTGHYQPINDEVLADIKNGSNYIFNSIEIFGGDSFVCMFGFNRILQNDADGTSDHFNHSVIFPVETRVNIDLRKGNHISKDRSYNDDVSYQPLNLDGLVRDSDKNKWEEFNYNDGYSTENNQDYYLPLPRNFVGNNNFDVRIRHSSQKTYGELIDSFRRFAALNYIDVNTEHGQINNIRSRSSRLIYWQDDAVGYVPVNERALSVDQFGAPVQLGVSGLFDRYDNLLTLIGNSNQFGLIESPVGFHWYDASRKIFITLTNSFQFSNDSIVKGLDDFFVNTLPDEMYKNDNPLKDRAIFGGYDPRSKLIFASFKWLPDQKETVALSVKGNFFVGFFDFNINMYFQKDEDLFGIKSGMVYKHASAESQGDYYGESNDSYFSIIVRDDSAIAKMFDSWEYIGSENPFTKIKFENSNQEAEELISSNRNFKFRNRRWFGNFPFVKSNYDNNGLRFTYGKERLVDGYLKITFYTDNSKKVSFSRLITNFRKMF